MSFDLEKIFAGKRNRRRILAALPLGEKLRMLDALRERELLIRRSRPVIEPALNEDSPVYRTRNKD